MDNELAALADAALIAGLSKGLKQSIDDLLAAGATSDEIKRLCRQRGGMNQPGRLTALACEAYIDAKIKS